MRPPKLHFIYWVFTYPNELDCWIDGKIRYIFIVLPGQIKSVTNQLTKFKILSLKILALISPIFFYLFTYGVWTIDLDNTINFVGVIHNAIWNLLIRFLSMCFLKTLAHPLCVSETLVFWNSRECTLHLKIYPKSYIWIIMPIFNFLFQYCK